MEAGGEAVRAFEDLAANAREANQFQELSQKTSASPDSRIAWL